MIKKVFKLFGRSKLLEVKRPSSYPIYVQARNITVFTQTSDKEIRLVTSDSSQYISVGFESEKDVIKAIKLLKSVTK